MSEFTFIKPQHLYSLSSKSAFESHFRFCSIYLFLIFGLYLSFLVLFCRLLTFLYVISITLQMQILEIDSRDADSRECRFFLSAFIFRSDVSPEFPKRNTTKSFLLKFCGNIIFFLMLYCIMKPLIFLLSSFCDLLLLEPNYLFILKFQK